MAKLMLLMLVLAMAACTQSMPPEPPENDIGSTFPDDTTDENSDGMMDASDGMMEDNTVRITASGFEPRELSVKAGETVTWVNENGPPRWPASNRHPTHTNYPGSGIEKCGTAEEAAIFDACMNMQSGESYMFTFNEGGQWLYHDHSDPKAGGVILVS